MAVAVLISSLQWIDAIDHQVDVYFKQAQRQDVSVALVEDQSRDVVGDFARLPGVLMAEPARGSWLAFDNYYSDTAFPMVVANVLHRRPATLMDIGANTGKWAVQCLRHDTDLHMVLVDLRQVDNERTGAAVEEAALEAGISLNKNMVPDDPRKPMKTSGIRVGSPAMTDTSSACRFAATVVSGSITQ